jgi:hypothetical protein
MSKDEGATKAPEGATKAPQGVTKAPADPIIVDLGKKRRKHIKALRKGKPGPLLTRIQEAIGALEADGTIAAGAQPIIVVVRERPRKPGWLGG